MNETTLVKRIRVILLSAGAYVEKNHGHSHETAGRPDLTGCLKGRFFGIEVKMPGEKVTAIQEYVMILVRDAGGIAFMADNVDRVDEFLRVFPNVCVHGLFTNSEDGDDSDCDTCP